MRREAAREALGFLLQTAAMFSLHIISAVVLVYCTIATASPTSDAWFMKEIADLMEAKEQMDEIINKAKKNLDLTEIEEENESNKYTEANKQNDGEIMDKFFEGEKATETEMEQELDWLVRASNNPETCDVPKCPSSLEIIKRINIVMKDVPETCREVRVTLRLEFERLRNTIKIPAPSSCKDLDQKLASGIHPLLGNDGKLHEVYCELGEFGNGQSGGWMRLAKFGPKNCPEGLKVDDGKKYCKRPNEIREDGGCFSVVFPTNKIGYSRVYGKIIGIQKGTTDAFEPTYNKTKHNIRVSISDPYLDGISLTYGAERSHIWSFASEYSSTVEFNSRRCPCNTNNNSKSMPPDFVGKYYFCDTGTSMEEIRNYGKTFETPLWDECGSNDDACCVPDENPSTPPWFHREIGNTCSDIEMRVCTNQKSYDEDVFIKEMELYVQ